VTPDSDTTWTPVERAPEHVPLVGIHIAFPKTGGDGAAGPKVLYMVGSVWQRIEAISVAQVQDDEIEELDDEQ